MLQLNFMSDLWIFHVTGLDRGTFCSKCTCFHAFEIAKFEICNCDFGWRWMHNAWEKCQRWVFNSPVFAFWVRRCCALTAIGSAGSETWNGQACCTSMLNIQVFISLILAESPELEEIDVDSLLEQLKQRKDDRAAVPTCISSVITSIIRNLLLPLSSKHKLHHSISVVPWTISL